MTRLLERLISAVHHNFFVDTDDAVFVYCEDAGANGPPPLHIRTLSRHTTLEALRSDEITLCQAKVKALRDRRFVTVTQIRQRYIDLYDAPATNTDSLCLACADYALETAGFYG